MDLLKRQHKKRRRPRSRRTMSAAAVFLHCLAWSSLPVFVLASSKREPQWSFLTDKSLGSLYVSEDESEERILAALADVSESDYKYADYDTTEPETKPLPNKRLPRRVNSSRSSRTKQASKAKKEQSKLSYVTLPETYRAVPAPTVVRPTLPKSNATDPQPAKQVMTNNPQQQQQQPAMSPWIKRFLASCRDDALLPLPLDYLLDNFNLAQLAPVVERIASQELPSSATTAPIHDDKSQPFPLYKQALELLVQQPQQDGDDESTSIVVVSPQVDTAARALYILLHQRFCLSSRGLDMVRRHFLAARSSVFGDCPSCRTVSLLPCGASDQYNDMAAATLQQSTTKRYYCQRYCCQCRQVFDVPNSQVDGCAWGTSFCHLFVASYGKGFLKRGKSTRRENAVEDTTTRQTASNVVATNPRPLEASIFGFRMYEKVAGLPQP